MFVRETCSCVVEDEEAILPASACETSGRTFLASQTCSFLAKDCKFRHRRYLQTFSSPPLTQRDTRITQPQDSVDFVPVALSLSQQRIWYVDIAAH